MSIGVFGSDPYTYNDAPKRKDPDPAPETIYGYPVKDLIVFAELCRRHDITEDELHNFVNNFSLAYQYGIEEQNREAKEMVQRILNNVISHAHVFKIPEIKEGSNEQQE